MSVSAIPSTFFYTFVAMLALASATQDIAVDAFTIRATPTELLGPVNSVRVTAYRIALTSPGILALVAQRFGWDMAFRAAAVVALAILVFTKFIPSEVVTTFIPSEARDQRSNRDEAGQVAAPPMIPRSARDKAVINFIPSEAR